MMTYRFLHIYTILSLAMVNAFIVTQHPFRQQQQQQQQPQLFRSTTELSAAASSVPPPTLNGKVTFPFKTLSVGLRGHTVAAVYAILNKTYNYKNNEWEHVEYIGYTKDLQGDLESHMETYGSRKVAHVRALSFAFPQRTAMMEVANRWKEMTTEAGGNTEFTEEEEEDTFLSAEEEAEVKRKEQMALELMMANVAFHEEEDDDDDDDDDYNYEDLKQLQQPTTIKETVISPFTEEEEQTVISPFSSTEEETSSSVREALSFNLENVDKILDEVRPYLISDGGNVSVQSVDETTKNVYLVLEGACGSCPSSTVTMQMGIERVLRENYNDLGQVLQVVPEEEQPESALEEAIQQELNRISPAINAMGGVVEVVTVDPSLGVVEMKFRGPNRVQQGLELAIRDVPNVKHIKFIM